MMMDTNRTRPCLTDDDAVQQAGELFDQLQRWYIAGTARERLVEFVAVRLQETYSAGCADTSEHLLSVLKSK